MIRRTHHKADKGAVLLTALLLMSIMSALAVAMLDEIRTAILRAGNIQAYAQADWYVKAAEEFAQSYIEENYLVLGPAEKNAALRVPLISALPISETGIMTLSVYDGTQCLPLSSLRNSGGEDDDRPAGNSDIFKRLLTNAGVTELDAASLTSAVIDWQDDDQQLLPGGAEDYTYLGLTPPYRTPNSPMVSVAELRAVRGMDEDILTAISPFICTGDPERGAQVNINTLANWQVPLLSAMLGEGEDQLASQILQARPGEGFTDLKQDLAAASVDATKVNFASFVTEPQYLWIEVDLDNAGASRTVLLEFKIDSGSLSRTYRHYGTEGRRPTISLDENETRQDQQ